MKIIEFRAENVKKLKAVDIRPDSNMVQITGRNGQGKTSVLDAIWWAMTTGRNVQAQPIRKGCDQAVIRLTLGTSAGAELIVTRTFDLKEGGDFTNKLKVQSADGAPMQKPQDVLNALCGELAYDPLELMRMDARGQFDVIKRLVPGIDFAQIAADQKKDFDRRTDVNRQAKALRAQADGITLPVGKLPALVDTTALEAKLGEAAQHNSDVAQRQARRDRVADDVKLRRDNAATLRQQAEDAEKSANDLEAQLLAAEALPAPIDIVDVQRQLTAAREGNKVAQVAAQRTTLEAEAKKLEEESARLTKAMDNRETGKREAIAMAKLPVDGLGIGDDVITLNDLPFDQASDAQQLEASLAIAASLNPELRVIRIRDGSLLDVDAMARLTAFAETRDFQVWIEVVGSGGGVGFELENGELKSETQTPAPVPTTETDEEPI